MSRLRFACLLLGLGLVVGFPRRAEAAPGPTFEQRVAAQAALEEVYWRHRTWPEANKDPKPRLRAVLSDAALRERVREYLDAGASLEKRWGRPITPADLQAEIDRMAAHTKDPDLLRELWAALGNDPVLIAECLARPSLARRLENRGEPGQPGPTTLTSAPYTLPAITGAACTDDTWKSFVFHPFPYAKSEHVAVWTGSEMIVWSGYLDVQDGMRYNPSTDAWTAIRNDDTTPAGRANASAVWTGREMIVWGGMIGNYPGHPATLINTGGRYDPTSDTWTATRVDANTPSARALAPAFWTGREMIVWGGADSSGARYNPSSDSWTPMSGDGMQLTSRTGSSVVWSGTEMIVWGGALPHTYSGPPNVWTGFNTGARYNPETDTWTPLSTLNAPSARQDHAAVWIGSEMLVVSGQYYIYSSGPPVPHFVAVDVYSGARYNPATDSWTTISSANKALALQSAFWTGTDVLVYPALARYRPQTDVWSNMSPFVFQGLTTSPGRAIWADTMLIAWGGNGGTGNIGGRYDPVSDSWLPTAGSVLSPPAQETAAVWTGAEMIVWGGGGSLSGSDIGGRYDPALDQWFPVRHDATTPSARYGDDRVGWYSPAGRTVQSDHRHMEAHRRQCGDAGCAHAPFRHLDRHRDDRLGRIHTPDRQLSKRRRTVQSGHGHLEYGIDRRFEPDATHRPYRRLGKQPYGRLGRRGFDGRRSSQHRRTLRSGERFVAPDAARRFHPVRQDQPHRGVHRESHDRLGRRLPRWVDSLRRRRVVRCGRRYLADDPGRPRIAHCASRPRCRLDRPPHDCVGRQQRDLSLQYQHRRPLRSDYGSLDGHEPDRRASFR